MSFDLDKTLSGLMQISIILFAATVILLSVSAVVPFGNTIRAEVIDTTVVVETAPAVTEEYVEFTDGMPVTYLEFPEFHITGRVH